MTSCQIGQPARAGQRGGLIARSRLSLKSATSSSYSSWARYKHRKGNFYSALSHSGLHHLEQTDSCQCCVYFFTHNTKKRLNVMLVFSWREILAAWRCADTIHFRTTPARSWPWKNCSTGPQNTFETLSGKLRSWNLCSTRTSSSTKVSATAQVQLMSH